MDSKKVRIAYLKRMLKRLEGDDEKLRGLVSSGELTPDGLKLAIEQLNKSREQLATELRELEE